METGLKAAEMYLKHRSRVKVKKAPSRQFEAADNTEKREIRVTPPPRQKIYNYEQPLNPIIPLTTQSEGGGHSRYFPARAASTEEKVRFSPEKHQHHHQQQQERPTRLPAIKFDHPVRPGAPDIGRAPVLPPSHTRYDVDVQGPKSIDIEYFHFMLTMCHSVARTAHRV